MRSVLIVLLMLCAVEAAAHACPVAAVVHDAQLAQRGSLHGHTLDRAGVARRCEPAPSSPQHRLPPPSLLALHLPQAAARCACERGRSHHPPMLARPRAPRAPPSRV